MGQHIASSAWAVDVLGLTDGLRAVAWADAHVASTGCGPRRFSAIRKKAFQAVAGMGAETSRWMGVEVALMLDVACPLAGGAHSASSVPHAP